MSVAIITALGAIAVAIISGAFALAAQRGKEDRGYMRERIATLEAREDATLAPLVAALRDQQATLGTVSEFVGILMEDKRYEERRRQEGRAV